MIEIDDVINMVGTNFKRKGGEYVFACPICRANGNDKHGDNLRYNPNKKLLWCFADEGHAKTLLSEYNKNKKEEENRPMVITAKLEYQYMLYWSLWNEILIGHDCSLTLKRIKEQEMYNTLELDQIDKVIDSQRVIECKKYLYEHWKFDDYIILKGGLGFDFIEKRWIFPIYNLNCKLVGFEYRGGNLSHKKIWRQKGTPKCMSWISGAGEDLYVVEGYKDGLSLIGLLAEEGLFPQSSIVTSSAGVSATYDLISQINFNRYKNIYLCLDNDKVSREVTNKIIDRYPFIIDKTPNVAGCKDISDVWQKKS